MTNAKPTLPKVMINTPATNKKRQLDNARLSVSLLASKRANSAVQSELQELIDKMPTHFAQQLLDLHEL